MNDKNILLNASKAIEVINNFLNKLMNNPYVVCQFKNEDGDIKEGKFILDNGATQIIKAYYKNKENKEINNG